VNFTFNPIFPNRFAIKDSNSDGDNSINGLCPDKRSDIREQAWRLFPACRFDHARYKAADAKVWRCEAISNYKGVAAISRMSRRSCGLRSLARTAADGLAKEKPHDDHHHHRL
jgi:hypothetical protein